MSTQMGGIDFSQYQSWQKITAPTGAVYYVIPDTGYVYDPFLSAQKGRPILWENPLPEYEKKQEYEQEQADAKSRAKKAASPEGQLLPIVGVVGGTVGAKYLVDALGPATALEAAQANYYNSLAGSSSAGAASAGTSAAPASTAADAFVTSAAPAATSAPISLGAEGIQTLADGSILMSDGTIQAATQTAGETAATAGAEAALGIQPYLGAAGAALGAYGVYNAIESDDTLSGGISGAGMGLGLGMAAPLVGMGPLGWGALGLMALGGAGLGAGLTEVLGHKSTKQYQAERWGELEEKGIVNAGAAFQANHAADDDGVWNEGQFAGKKWNWEDARTLAKQDPIHFNLVLGNYETFGNDWDQYSQEQRNQIMARLLDEDLYHSTKGDIRIKNEDRAREIKDQVLSGITVAPATNIEVQPTPPPDTQTAQAQTKIGTSNMSNGKVAIPAIGKQPATPIMGAMLPTTPAGLRLPGAPGAPASPVMGAQSVSTPVGVFPVNGVRNPATPVMGAPSVSTPQGFMHPALAVYQGLQAEPVQRPVAAVPQMGNMGAVPLQRPVAAVPAVEPQRTMTRSPGIGLDGKPLSPEQLGRMLAKKANERRR